MLLQQRQRSFQQHDQPKAAPATPRTIDHTLEISPPPKTSLKLSRNMLCKGACSCDQQMINNGLMFANSPLECKRKSTQMVSWKHRKFTKIASRNGPEGVWGTPTSLTCNMMCTKGGQGNPAAHLFRDLGAVWAPIGSKLGAEGTPKTM